MTEEDKLELIAFVEQHDRRHILDKSEFSKFVVEETLKILEHENDRNKRIYKTFKG